MRARPKPSNAAEVRGLEYPKLTLDVPEAFVEAVAQRVAAILAERHAAAASPWLNTEQAAAHLACSTARVHDLVALKKLTPRRDGRRLLFRRDDLDAYVEDGSA